MIKKQWLLIALCMAVSVMAEFRRTAFFGCSTTDTYDGFPEILAGSGDSVEYVKYTVPGCGMQCLYQAVGVPASFQGKSWYCMTAAPFANGAELGVNNDVKYISYWYDVALQSNPDCILYVFSMYAGKDWGQTWDQAWNSVLDTTKAGYAQPYGSEDYQYMMVNALRAKYPGKKVYMMGVAHVMNAFQLAPFPGFSGAFGLFADGIHLNKYGQYLQNLTAYATIWRKHPASAGTYFSGGWGNNGQIEADFAARAKDLVWNTVSNSALTGYTGVSGGPVAVALPASAVTPVRQAGISSKLVTIDGRSVLPAAAACRGRKGSASVRIPVRNGVDAGD